MTPNPDVLVRPGGRAMPLIVAVIHAFTEALAIARLPHRRPPRTGRIGRLIPAGALHRGR